MIAFNDQDGETALISCAKYSNRDVLKLLLQCSNLDVSCCDKVAIELFEFNKIIICIRVGDRLAHMSWLESCPPKTRLLPYDAWTSEVGKICCNSWKDAFCWHLPAYTLQARDVGTTAASCGALNFTIGFEKSHNSCIVATKNCCNFFHAFYYCEWIILVLSVFYKIRFILFQIASWLFGPASWLSLLLHVPRDQFRLHLQPCR